LSVAGGYSLPWFGLLSWPRLLPLDKTQSCLGEWLHYYGAWCICALLLLHWATVIWHRFAMKDAVFLPI
jgi:cytochrome b561